MTATPTNPVIEIPRIDAGKFHLSPLMAADRADLVAYLNDREIYDQTLRIPFPYREEDADQFLGIVSDSSHALGQAVHFAIRDEQGRLVGSCGWEHVVPQHSAEIGYWVARPWWGKGIATATVQTFRDYARQVWQLVRITAHVFTTNPASARVLEKAGFHKEGTHRYLYRKNDRLIDAWCYAWIEDGGDSRPGDS